MKSAAGDVRERHESADKAERHQRPLVDQDCRGDAEGDDVRQAVELDAEDALSLGEAGDAAVEAIEEHREKDRQRRLVELSGGGFRSAEGDGVKAAKDGRQREQVWENEQQSADLHRGPRLDFTVNSGSWSRQSIAVRDSVRRSTPLSALNLNC